MGPSRLGYIVYYMSLYLLLERWFDLLNRLINSGRAGIFILLVRISFFSLFSIALLMKLDNFSGVIVFTTYNNQKYDMYQYCKRMFYQAVYFSCIQVSNHLFLHIFWRTQEHFNPQAFNHRICNSIGFAWWSTKFYGHKCRYLPFSRL